MRLNMKKKCVIEILTTLQSGLHSEYLQQLYTWLGAKAKIGTSSNVEEFVPRKEEGMMTFQFGTWLS